MPEQYEIDADTQALLATARITVDLDAIAANWGKLAGLAPNARTGAAVKADAYGLGEAEVGAALARAGCRHFFVATPAEGLTLRRAVPDAEIFVLAGLSRHAAPYFVESDLVPVLNDPGDIELWAKWCRQAGFRRPAALHGDTGMNRLGLSLAQLTRFVSDPEQFHSITPSLVMSHLACADQPEHEMNARQLAGFREIAGLFPDVRASLSGGAGLLLGPDYHFDITRPGFSIYGGESVTGAANPMQPVVSFEGRILQIRHAKKGESVGYGATAALERDSVIATVGAGYADGLLRAASGSGVPRGHSHPGARGWLAGHEVPIIGRISMDLTGFDVTDVPAQTLETAEWIEFFGENIPLEDFARSAGTIGYEVLKRLSTRAARTYVGG